MNYQIRLHSEKINRKRMRHSNIFFPLLFTVSVVMGQDIPKPMNPARLVNDFTGLLTEQQQMELNNKLLEFNNQTSTQIYTVTNDDLQGFPVNEYGFHLGRNGESVKKQRIMVFLYLSACQPSDYDSDRIRY